MAWHSLGTLSPGVAWQSYPVDVVNCETLRIIQTWGSDRPVSYALLAQYFPIAEGIATIHKIWAIDNQPRIITFPIPEVLRQADYFMYTPLLKLGRFPHMGIENWHIELQVFY